MSPNSPYEIISNVLIKKRKFGQLKIKYSMLITISNLSFLTLWSFITKMWLKINPQPLFPNAKMEILRIIVTMS